MRHDLFLRSAQTLLEHFLEYGQRGKCVWPAGVEGEMRNDLAGLLLRQPVIHRPAQMIRDLRDLTGCHEGTDGNKAPVARRQTGPQPKIPEQHVCRILDDPGGDVPELLTDPRRPLRLGCLIEGKLRAGSWRKLFNPDVASL